jgi:RNA polymerase sigma-70 factor (ECF subfamily)
MLCRMAAWVAAQTEERLGVEEFERWMAAEQRRIATLCLRMAQNREEAENLAQETFLRAFEMLRRGGRVDDPAKWITRVAVNVCLDHLRSRRWQFWKRASNGADVAAVDLTIDGAPGPESLLLARQIGARIAAGLDRLSDRQRSVFVLRHYEHRPLDEIAEILALDLGTVKTHLSRAVARLRVELTDLYGR